ncbi:hypothetical protein F4780DRAFT_137261 [Xylariomycetidae sp. FL0641]|nr:hypothetical protein F4780DRAFT_137261 [Xylariomycetidae sp. FL0641]
MATSTKPAATEPPSAQLLHLPRTLRWRPLPAPLDGRYNNQPSVPQTPSGPVPCRRCLRDSAPGEPMLLASYDAFLGPSPYRGATAIYLHAAEEGDCAPATATAGAQLRSHGPLAVRTFDAEHMLVGAEIVEGDAVVAALERMLRADGGAAYAHLHFAVPGCFAVRVDRVSAEEA